MQRDKNKNVADVTDVVIPSVNAMTPVYWVTVGDTDMLALLDSGACQNFMNRDLATKLCLPTKTLARPYSVMVADGTRLSVNREVS